MSTEKAPRDVDSPLVTPVRTEKQGGGDTRS